MTATQTLARSLLDGRLVGTQAVVARHLASIAADLGMPPVSTNQVWTWCRRRTANGCPEPLARDVVADASTGHAAGTVDWYDLAEWSTWWLRYDPTEQRRRGGAPPGNTYARRTTPTPRRQSHG